ncbi:hypothetical protein [Phenylobacterium sp.]|uniref:hypothetical protein n=1 Tax=Phenylobacterium sp. TaxID=1871053 RepID=UPI0025F266B0|nr:hypothetical protein [Phenylobacterium sp.]
MRGFPNGGFLRAEFTGWVGGAHRARRNMLESLVLFVALVAGRAALAAIYIVGAPYLRAAAWIVASSASCWIFLQLI